MHHNISIVITFYAYQVCCIDAPVDHTITVLLTRQKKVTSTE
jgi:hypothetical protein